MGLGCAVHAAPLEDGKDALGGGGRARHAFGPPRRRGGARRDSDRHEGPDAPRVELLHCQSDYRRAGARRKVLGMSWGWAFAEGFEKSRWLRPFRMLGRKVDRFMLNARWAVDASTEVKAEFEQLFAQHGPFVARVLRRFGVSAGRCGRREPGGVPGGAAAAARVRSARLASDLALSHLRLRGRGLPQTGAPALRAARATKSHRRRSPTIRSRAPPVTNCSRASSVRSNGCPTNSARCSCCMTSRS